MSAISGSVEHQPQRLEEDRVSKVALVYHKLPVFLRFLSDREYSPSHSSPLVKSWPVTQRAVKRLQRRKRKCRNGRHQRKCKKRRCRNRNVTTFNTPTIFWTRIPSLCEQVSSICRILIRRDSFTAESEEPHFDATFRGETVPVKSKPPQVNHSNTPEDSGFASQASTSTKRPDPAATAEPVADTKTDNGHHQINNKENKFQPASTNGAQCIPPNAEKVTLPSQIAHSNFSVYADDSIAYVFSEVDPPLNQQRVKPFTCQLGDELSLKHGDGLSPVNLAAGPTAMDQYLLSCERQPEEYRRDEGGVLIDGYCIPQQAGIADYGLDRSELVAPPLPLLPWQNHEEADFVPQGPSGVQYDLYSGHGVNGLTHGPNSTEQTLPSAIEPFSWPPPGFTSFF